MSPADAVGSDLGVDQLCADVHGHLAALRASSPVAYVAAIGGFLVTSHALALAVMRDPETFTVDDPRFSTARVVGPSMLSLDGAAHGRHRAAFAPGYRPRQVDERFGPFAAERAGRLVRRLSSPAAAANRDPAVWPEPDRFVLDRPAARRHLAFAAGPHVCLGMDLARLEARTALGALLRAHPGAELAPGAPGPTGWVFRKPSELPVVLGSAASPVARCRA